MTDPVGSLRIPADVILAKDRTEFLRILAQFYGPDAKLQQIADDIQGTIRTEGPLKESSILLSPIDPPGWTRWKGLAKDDSGKEYLITATRDQRPDGRDGTVPGIVDVRLSDGTKLDWVSKGIYRKHAAATWENEVLLRTDAPDAP
jgi:hypothetical protein